MVPSRDGAVYKVYIAVADTGRRRHRMRTRVAVSRRKLLQGAAFASATAALGLPRFAFGTRGAGSPRPFPLSAVRLAPSPWLQAVEANRAYLARLEPDRLLHNFREQAGLAPKGAPYGGWEAETIAGH